MGSVNSSVGSSPALQAAITAGGGIIGTVISQAGNKRAQKRAVKYNKELMDYQNNMALSNWQLENQRADELYVRERQDALSDWNMQNAYNSPEAQMLRYKQAGLNPNLIYGQSNEGASFSSPSYGGVGSVGEYGVPNTPETTDNMTIIGNALRQGITDFYDTYARNQSLLGQSYDNENKKMDLALRLNSFEEANQATIAQWKANLQKAKAEYEASKFSAGQDNVKNEAWSHFYVPDDYKDGKDVITREDFKTWYGLQLYYNLKRNAMEAFYEQRNERENATNSMLILDYEEQSRRLDLEAKRLIQKMQLSDIIENPGTFITMIIKSLMGVGQVGNSMIDFFTKYKGYKSKK